jgi:hypothetical protein
MALNRVSKSCKSFLAIEIGRQGPPKKCHLVPFSAIFSSGCGGRAGGADSVCDPALHRGGSAHIQARSGNLTTGDKRRHT